MGFEVLDKGVYIDGHERDDVVESHQRFLRQLVAGGFLTAPSPEASAAFPSDIEPPSTDSFSTMSQHSMPMVMSGGRVKTKLFVLRVVVQEKCYPISSLRKMVFCALLRKNTPQPARITPI